MLFTLSASNGRILWKGDLGKCDSRLIFHSESASELYRVHVNPLIMAAPLVTSCLYIWALHDQTLPPPFFKLGFHVAFSDMVSPAGIGHAKKKFFFLHYSHLFKQSCTVDFPSCILDWLPNFSSSLKSARHRNYYLKEFYWIDDERLRVL